MPAVHNSGEIGTGDGIGQGDARPNEMKSVPLWGMPFRKQPLHDGGALSPASETATAPCPTATAWLC